ncbi:MAG: hypothetical protein R3258_08580 [Acidimicrobiia bacterium]|nr:hypothetical protein [Acidimicrobiia bacterium]
MQHRAGVLLLLALVTACQSEFHDLENSAVVQVRHEVLRVFPQVRDGGSVACRQQIGALGDASLWSQHAYGNAWDAAVPDLQTGDAVYEYLVANRERLRLGIIIWRQPDHFDHLHIESIFQGVGTPRCADTLPGS